MLIASVADKSEKSKKNAKLFANAFQNFFRQPYLQLEIPRHMCGRASRNSTAVQAFARLGIQELCAKLLAKQFGWAGHVIRLPADGVAAVWAKTCTVEQWHLTQAVYSTLDASNTSAWRHTRRGSFSRWEDNLVRVLCDLWRHRAADRLAWRSMKASFIWEACNHLLGSGHRCFGVSEPSPDQLSPQVSEYLAASDETGAPENLAAHWPTLRMGRGAAQTAVSCFRHGLHIQLVGDSQLLVDLCLGKAASEDRRITRVLSVAQEALRRLTQSCSCKPPWAKQIVQQTPRTDNSAVDRAANQALDSGDFHDSHDKESLNFLHYCSSYDTSNVGLLVSFDGASRGNPGPASYGICMWWGTWGLGGFNSEGLLLRHGACIGRAGNNIAEARGLAAAAKTCLHWHLWILEQCAQAVAQRASSHLIFALT